MAEKDTTAVVDSKQRLQDAEAGLVRAEQSVEQATETFASCETALVEAGLNPKKPLAPQIKKKEDALNELLTNIDQALAEVETVFADGEGEDSGE